MAWTPTNKVINTRTLASNILAFIAANQAEALEWANGAAGMIAFQDINDSVANRNNPVYPSIALKDDNDEVVIDDDILQPAYSVTFEVVIENQHPSTAVTKARVYDFALKSMLRNMTSAELTNGLSGITATLLILESGFREIQTNDSQNDFFQVFEIRATFRLTGAAY